MTKAIGPVPVLEIEISKAMFNEVYIPYLESPTPVEIFFGGSTSGKSVFLAQRLVLDLLKGDRNYLVCRAVAKYLTKSVWAEVESVIDTWGLRHLFHFRYSARVIICLSNSREAIFVGLDDTEKLKSIRASLGAITDVWVEEATEISKPDLKTLQKRQRGGDADVVKRIIFSFNPILQQHWLYKEFFESIGWADDQTEFQSDSISILKTWYIHNRWNTPQDVQALEDEADEYFKEVYTWGNWGVLGDVIFKNWEVRDLSGMHDQFTNRRHGGDFGYASDPAAIVVTHYDRSKKEIYVYNELYETGLTNDVLAAEQRRLVKNELVIWDSAEPKSIAELNKHKANSVGAVKGKDSVLHGIQWLQQHKIIVDKGCLYMQNELRQFQWKKGRDGIALSPPRPIGINDHLIAALRYAYEGEMREVWLI